MYSSDTARFGNMDEASTVEFIGNNRATQRLRRAGWARADAAWVALLKRRIWKLTLLASCQVFDRVAPVGMVRHHRLAAVFSL